jgi:hypothetical protein
MFIIFNGIRQVVLMRRRIGVLEKMWAHLTIRQLLDKYMIEGSDSDSEEAQDQNRQSSTARDRALALALKVHKYIAIKMILL